MDMNNYELRHRPQDQETTSAPHPEAHMTSTTLSKKPFSFYMSILLCGLIGWIVAMDATSVNVTIPAIADELDGTTLESFWASISFMLVVAVTQPVYMSMSDALGRKLLLYVSLLLFAIGSIVFAAAKRMSIVIVGRVLKGFGGGGLDVLQVIILSDLTTLRERAFYIGVNAVFNAFGNISGLAVGGLFSEFVSWRWIGWLNLPFVGISLLLTILFLRLKPINMELETKVQNLDWIGMLLFTIGATSLALPLSWAGALFPWSSWKTIVPLVIGLVLLTILAFYEKKPEQPMFPYRIFNNITAVASIISGFFHGLITYTVQAYIPLFYQAVFLQPPLQSALSSLPFSATMVAFAAISGIAVNFARRYRVILWFGWFLATTFLGLYCLVNGNTPRAESYSFQVLMGAGIGTVLTVTALPTQASVTHVDDTGFAAGMLVIFRLFGALIGLTIGSTVFSSVFQQKVAAVLPLPQPIKVLEDASKAVSFIPSLRTLELPRHIVDGIIKVYQESFQAIWIVMTCISGVGLIISLLIKELTLERDDIGRQGLQGR